MATRTWSSNKHLSHIHSQPSSIWARFEFYTSHFRLFFWLQYRSLCTLLVPILELLNHQLLASLTEPTEWTGQNRLLVLLVLVPLLVQVVDKMEREKLKLGLATMIPLLYLGILAISSNVEQIVYSITPTPSSTHAWLTKRTLLATMTFILLNKNQKSNEMPRRNPNKILR